MTSGRGPKNQKGRNLTHHPLPIDAAVEVEAGRDMATWLLGIATLCGLHVVPGKHFWLCRDLLVYPAGHFLEVGLVAVCATAAHPTLSRAPFLSYSFLPPGHIDPLSFNLLVSYMHTRHRYSRNFENYRQTVLFLFNRGGRPFMSGLSMVRKGIESGRMPEISEYLNAKKLKRRLPEGSQLLLELNRILVLK